MTFVEVTNWDMNPGLLNSNSLKLQVPNLPGSKFKSMKKTQINTINRQFLEFILKVKIQI